MNRVDKVIEIVRLEQIAEQAKGLAAKLRGELDAEAQAEYAAQGTAPTWRIADVATVSASVTRQRVAVDDADALTGWVAERHPMEVIEVVQVRSAFLAGLLGAIRSTDDLKAYHPETGELVPGLVIQPGGQYKSLSIRVAPEAKELLAESARLTLATIQQQGGQP